MKTFHGIIPAVVTPFDEQGQLNIASFEKLLERVYEAGVHGIYINGSTGEGLLQPTEQRKKVAEVAIKNSPNGKQVIVHIGANSTAESIELARHAAAAGAAGVSCLPPPGGNYSFAEVKEYYRSIAAASDCPMLAYYFPALNPAIKTVDELLEICALPNVSGLKFTDYNLFALSIIRKSGATIFNGYDEVLAAGLLMGADGGIGTTYTLMPELFMNLYRAAQNDDWIEARQWQERINEVIAILIRFPIFPATKAILKSTGIDCGHCLAPRRRLTDGEERELLNLLKDTNISETFHKVSLSY